MSAVELRRSPRYSFNSQIDLLLHGTWSKGTLIDMSLSGALVASGTASDAGLGKTCGLHFSEFEQAIPGIVVRTKPDQVALHFIGLRKMEQDALMLVIAGNRASASMLERDVPTMIKYQ